MVGVCLIVIGFYRFWFSCKLSYWALRSRSVRRMHRLEEIGDGIFIFAMIGMVIICTLITYTISVQPDQALLKATPRKCAANSHAEFFRYQRR
jgi:hypothetical protein